MNKWKHTKAALLEIEKKTICTICCNLPEDPHILRCKHSFCKKCISTLLKCPKCGFNVSPKDVIPNMLLRHLLHVFRITSELSTSNNAKEVKTTLIESSTKQNSIKCINTEPKEKTPTIKICDNQDNFLKQNTSSIQRKRRIKTPKQKLTNIPPAVGLDKTPNSRAHLLKNARKHDEIGNITPTSSATPKFKSSPKRGILFYGKKTNLPKVNAKGETSLQIACRKGVYDLVRKLLDSGAEPNVKDYAGWTPLCDAVGSGNIEVVRLLLKAGAGVNTPAHKNTTALVEAVLRKDKHMILLLLECGADIHQRTVMDNTAWSIADDEIKSMLKNSSSSAIAPHVKTKVTPNTFCVVNLPQEQVTQVLYLCQKFNITLTTEFIDDVTHVIVEKSIDNTCHGSVAVMTAILHGCSVVGMDWVLDCLKADDLLPVDKYEPHGTEDFPNSNVFQKSRINRECLLPRLFHGCHISLQHDQTWPATHRNDIISLIHASGAVFLPRQCDPERISSEESTVMFHTDLDHSFAYTSHIVLYQPGDAEPLLKYNMEHFY